MSKYLASAEYSTLLAGLTLANVQEVLSTVMLAISCIVGIVNLFIMVKHAFDDGEVSEDEMKDIEKQVDELKDKFDKENKDDRDC